MGTNVLRLRGPRARIVLAWVSAAVGVALVLGLAAEAMSAPAPQAPTGASASCAARTL
jgi:hypothetical protein